MPIDVGVADGTHLEVKKPVLGELLHHVRQKPDWSLHLVLAAAIEIELDGDLGLLGSTLYGRRSSHDAATIARKLLGASKPSVR